VSGPLQAVREAVLGRLLSGESLAGLPLQRIDGRFDLRGIFSNRQEMGGRQVGQVLEVNPAGQRRGFFKRRVEPQIWQDLDLRFADLPEMRWMNIDVVGCRFDYAHLQGLRCWGVHVTDSCFAGADVRMSQWGPHQPDQFRRSVWQQVDFSRADIRSTSCELDFVAVNFSHAKFTNTHWGWSNLEGVTFEGRVHGLEIGGRPIAERPADWRITGVDLSRARLSHVSFIGVDLGVVDVQLPDDEHHLIIDGWPQYLARVRDRIAKLESERDHLPAQIWLDHVSQDSGPNQTTGVVAVEDIVGLGGENLLELLKSQLAS
jgi:uncharacterized protein YjbI with pentapeptide repeats